MTRLDHKVFIAAPPEAVWQALADLESVRHYNPLVHTVEIVGTKKGGPGASRRCEGPQGVFVETCEAWDPGRSLTMELTESKWPVVGMKWKTDLRADGAGTLMTQVTEYRPKFGPLGTVLDRLVLRRQLGRGIQGVFKDFKQYVEGRPTIL